jgi:hypothetical protein
MDIRWYGNHLSLMNMAIVLRPTYHDEIDAEIAMWVIKMTNLLDEESVKH